MYLSCKRIIVFEREEKVWKKYTVFNECSFRQKAIIRHTLQLHGFLKMSATSIFSMWFPIMLRNSQNSGIPESC